MSADIEMLANLHEFGGMLTYTVMQHNPITHQNEEVESTFSRPHADDLAGQSTWVRWVVERMVHFRGFADAQTRMKVSDPVLLTNKQLMIAYHSVDGFTNASRTGIKEERLRAVQTAVLEANGRGVVA